jgi:hypothetical protein
MKELLLFSLSKKKKKKLHQEICPCVHSILLPIFPSLVSITNYTEKFNPNSNGRLTLLLLLLLPLFFLFLKNIKEFLDLFRVCVCGSPSRVSKKKRAERITVVCNITEHSSYSSAYY